MSRSSHHDRETRALFALSATTLALALWLGGGPGASVAEQWLGLPGLALIVAAIFAYFNHSVSPGQARWFWLLPAALIALPLLQLVPLPHFLWAHLPGRGALVDDLSAAGVAPQMGRWTLAPLATEGIAWSAIVPIGVFMSAAMLHGSQRRRLVIVALVFAGFSALVGLWQLVEGSQDALSLYSPTTRGEVLGFFANRNHLAALLATALPVAAGVLADRLRRHHGGVRDVQAWLLMSLIILLAVGVTATQSRAGFMLLMASVVASAVVWLLAGKRRASVEARPWLRGAAVIAGVMIVQYTLYGTLVRLEADPLEDGRWGMASNTLLAAQPSLGTGLGLGTFVHAYDEVGDAAADIPAYVNHAHDDYLELWLEGGILAVVVMVAAIAVLAIQLVWRLRRVSEEGGQRGQQRGMEVGAAFALLLLLLHSIVDYPLRTLTIASFAALLAAVLLGSVREHHSRA